MEITMSDWDFLYEMEDLGYSEAEIQEAMFSGAAPWEWECISWDSIKDQLADQEPQAEYSPQASPAAIRAFEDLVAVAQEYKVATGRYLQIWGELGELYAEIKYGIIRHHPGTQGSDGRLGNDWIEIKTISPGKKTDTIQVKRAGNFNELIVVKISDEFKFQAKKIPRTSLEKGNGKHMKVSWQSTTRDKSKI
jgi:hypothetical protein